VDQVSEAIACSLGYGQAKDRAREWARLLERGAAELEPIAGGIRIELREDGLAAELERLVAAERACCPFMSMHVERTDEGLALTVRAPVEAEPLLAALFGAVR
jgi:MerR family transcriptional regulator, copper efflux regulator